MADKRTVEELALTIADQSARSVIENCSVYVPAAEHGRYGEWFDIDDPGADLEQEIRYLELRELLERHPLNPNWVQLFEEVPNG